jgi:hypothetical protein
MSRHVWTVKNLSRETTQRGLYAYCLAETPTKRILHQRTTYRG